ncbi:MAG: pantoate--beta-alanine ligase, partial [Flavobacteriaceae bacterium]|nr:pantoate--beta-alanine ligase [Flavobacteriaceae bacterium]
MKVFYHKNELKASKNKISAKSTGLVPTMGALHKGHIMLVKKALEDNELVLVSIFVNPTQFDSPNDLENYPKTLESDLQKLEKLKGKIWVYAPNASDLYLESIKAK